MAAELRSVGVDFSFAPVLDLDRGLSRVIGDRAFAPGAGPVSDLASAWVAGVRDAGMAAVGKHFPGHGGVTADSHEELPSDGRSFEEIEMDDLVPFERMIHRGLEAVMPAHVVYPLVDRHPAGFSKFWLRRVLRERLGFQGVIFSDDLDMAAAAAGGGYAERSRSALDAGCDVLLVCNNRPAALEVVESLRDHDDPTVHLRCLRMHGRGSVNRTQLHLDPRWQQALRAVAESVGLTPDRGLVAGQVDGQAVDLDCPLVGDCEVAFLKAGDKAALEILRALHQQGRLDPRRQEWIGIIEAELAATVP